MTAENGAIVADGIRKNYRHIEALRGLSLTVKEGEIFGLLGANGAGKTTLIKILIGVTRPDAGTARVLGYDPVRQARGLRQHIGYMPQTPALYEDLSARDNVRFFARGRAHKMPNLEKRIDEVMAFMDLAGRQRDPVYSFSGGMKQRLSLACALVHKPRLLCLDEPSTGVDSKLRESLWVHFRELAADGATIVLSTHQMDEAFHCDRVALIRDGRVLACDTPRGLLARGKAKITIWRGDQAQTEIVGNYGEELPKLLGIQTSVSRIEIEEDTLEDVVLGLINTTVTQQH